MKYISLLWVVSLYASVSFAQLLSPSEFLPHALGSNFSYQYQIVDYFEYLATQSDKVITHTYGYSYEERPLQVAIVSSAANLARIDDIRKQNLQTQRTHTTVPGQIPIIWFGFGIHGNEAASPEAAMQTLFELVSGKSDTLARWLDSMVVIIDPCMNPDGHEHYVNWYRSVKNKTPNILDESQEHNEPWPYGRYNHYLFDLNRDWCWQTQTESRQRVAYMRQWMPQIFADFHEMTKNKSYFFPPHAHPMHDHITDWHRDFQKKLGVAHSAQFKQRNWLFFSGDIYDLLYPGFTDTYMSFNGAIGVTYEQGGIGAGVASLIYAHDTLTLSERIDHHHVVALSTLETAYNNRAQLLAEYAQFYGSTKKVQYNSYIIKANNAAGTIRAFLSFLDQNGITYGHPDSSGQYSGYSYMQNKTTGFALETDDIVVNTDQPLSLLLDVLMQPETTLTDSLTYDMTAWAAPFIYELKAYATTNKITLSTTPYTQTEPSNHLVDTLQPYAFRAEGECFEDAVFLSELIKNKFTVSYSLEDFEQDNRNFNKGTLLINIEQDKPYKDKQVTKILEIARLQHKQLYPVYTENNIDRTDLAALKKQLITAPKVALVAGEMTHPSALGEVWHFFEEELQYPITLLYSDEIETSKLENYDILIIPNGDYYGLGFDDIFMNFAKKGGRIIALESALRIFNAYPGTSWSNVPDKTLSEQSLQAPSAEALIKYKDKNYNRISNQLAGCIYQMQVDNSHPLAFGNDTTCHIIKKESSPYPLLNKKGYNVATYNENCYVSGFAANFVKGQIPGSIAIGVEKTGKGDIVYFVDSPIFRGFWYNGKLWMSNAIFFRE